MTHRLVYSSIASVDLDEDELETLLGTARTRNRADGVTGLLLHITSPGGGPAAFAQVLEGDQGAVEATYTRIARDELHRDLRVLTRGYARSRSYGDWAMRLEKVDAGVLVTLASGLTGAAPAGDGEGPPPGPSEALRRAEVIERLLGGYAP